LQRLTAAVGVLGTLLYLVMRVVASQFYTPLGLTVEDVGLGQLSMLVRAAFGMLVIAGMYGAIWLALIAGIVFAFRVELGQSMTSKNTRRWVAAAFGVTAVTLLVGYWLIVNGGEVRLLIGVTVSCCTLTWLMGVWSGSMLQEYPRALFALAALMLLMLLSAGFFDNLAHVAHDDAKAVLSGQAPPTDTGGVPLMPYRAQIAHVAVGNSTSAAHKRCVVFLGQDGRSVVVYDPTSKRARLLPSDTAVAIDPRRRKCLRR
jgi:hypothetical protein